MRPGRPRVTPLRVCAGAYSFGGAPRSNPRAEQAQRVVERLVSLVKKGRKNELLDYLATDGHPDLTDTPTLGSGEQEVVVFEDVLERMLLLAPNKHFLDSYAIRQLILNAPATTQLMSGLLLGPNKYVQRIAVTSPTGESCVLTFTLTATQPPQAATPEPGTAAAAVAAAPPPPSPESAPPVWRLSHVRGEPAFGTAGVTPSGPSPELPPEQIVEAQLEALQRKDTAAAFRFLSPGSQKIIGSEEQFAQNMAKHRRYGGLLGHIVATSVRRCMTRPSMYMEIVSVTSASGTRFVFCYILGQETQGPTAGCWSIDFVKIVDDPRLLAAVESSCAAQRKGQADAA